MFNGDFMESRRQGCLEIAIPDVTPSAFREVLKWIYTDEFDLSLNSVSPLLYCVEKYDIAILRRECISFVEDAPLEDLCFMFTQAIIHGVIHLVSWIKNNIIHNPSRSLSLDSVLEIKDNQLLEDLFSSDTLNMDEKDVFNTALHWALSQTHLYKKDMKEILGPAFYAIRFPLFSVSQFSSFVVDSGLLKDQEIRDIESSLSTAFSNNPRVRTCDRFRLLDKSSIFNLKHYLVFFVDRPIKIYGSGVYKPSKKCSTISGIIRLERVDSTQSEENECLSAKIFDVEYSSRYPITRIYFDSPISIDPTTRYRLSLEYDESSLNVDCKCGWGGRRESVVDGVTFKFEDYKNNSNNLRALLMGQIPWICFSRLPCSK
ncbi:BTB/POZ domain-containing protein 3-like [Lepeophtheirus salmonis]|uniref:BTB/POZ domain-containing protein 3-like n=1 Tax=Lepeophtheirus salmonis TaxID=72036 RepID=UPI001AE822A2|nr:BTB/POZ domain-containing protein 3-like [Lepeophtheirus salmonis]